MGILILMTIVLVVPACFMTTQAAQYKKTKFRSFSAVRMIAAIQLCISKKERKYWKKRIIQYIMTRKEKG